MPKLKKHAGLVISLLFLLALFLTGCHAQTVKDTHQGGLRVVASLDMYGETAKQVLGNYGTTSSVIDNPNVDPEDYEPDTNTAKQIAKADLVVYNGLGYDDWMTRLIGANASGKAKQPSIAVGSSVLGKKDGDNPHVWYDPAVMPQLANRLAVEFGKLDPNHRDGFKKNAKRYIQSLASMQQKIKQIKRHRTTKQVAVSEPVFNYALAAMGYSVIDDHFSQAIEDGNDPSPADVRMLEKQIKAGKIAFFVENTQNTSSQVSRMSVVAKAAHVPVIKVTETLPSNSNYVKWMTSAYDDVLKAQQSKEGSREK